jgi:membrane-bound serine protease (ClpP class)
LIVPGAVGAICLLLVLGLQALPLNGFGLLLIGLAALLLVAEVYLTSFGVLGIAGLCSLVIGSYMLFDVPGSSFRLPPAVIWSVALAMAALMLVIGLLIVRVKRQGATSGPEALVGRHAVVSEAIDARGTGKIFFDGTYWNATAEVPIDKGARVRVDAFEGLRVRVSKLAEKEEGT